VADLTVVPPGVDRSNDWFWDGVAQGQLLVQRCRACGALRTPIAPMCGQCRSLEWDAVPVGGRGSIVSWIVSHHPTQPDAAPRIVVLVDLEEGVRVVSNVVDADPDAVANDLPVELTFRTYGDVTLPQFTLVGT
jgi:uncharacterized OB-fold protein